MDGRTAVAALLRRWWLIVALPLAVLIGSLAATSDPPYVATTRATVLIPGDTEAPGDAERPELMVLDDAPSLVRSRAFADSVMARLRATAPGLGLRTDEVQAALSATRYSRVVTVRARHEDRTEALAIGRAAAAVLPDAVNQYLVAAGGPPATVQIIDSPRQAVPDNGNRVLIVSVQTLVAVAVGIGLAALAASLDDRLYSAREVESLVGLPVLADVRTRRGGWRIGRFGTPRGAGGSG